MAVILNASTTTGFVQSADTSGILQIQSNGSTVLTVASTGVTATNIQGTIVQGTAVASTSGTSIDFTGIPSWAKRITVMFNGVSTSGSSIRLVQLGDAGGFEITGYTGSAFSWTGGSGGTGYSAGILLEAQPSNSSVNTFGGILTICNISSNTWVASGTFCSQTSANQNFTGGSKTLSETLDRIRITTVNGTDTFDAGTINIQYEG